MTNRDIKFVDVQMWSSSKEVKNAVNECLDSGSMSGGVIGKKLEKQLCEKYNFKNFSTVVNGTAALHLSLISLGVGINDYVISPNLTFVSTASSILMTGAKPILVDVQEDGNIDPESVEEACIKFKVKAVIVVHLYGNPCNLNKILELSKKYDFKIIEDCSQAIGSTFENKAVGSFGDFGTISFYASKNLPAGEGGGVICNNGSHEDILSRRNHGRTSHYDYDRLGYNYKMSDIFSSIIIANLTWFDEEIQKRRDQASYYYENFKKLDIEFIQQDVYGQSSYHQFVIIAENREDFRKDLLSKGINTSVVYPMPLINTKLFHDEIYFKNKSYDNYISSKCISLPIGRHLSKADLDYVINCVRQVKKMNTNY